MKYKLRDVVELTDGNNYEIIGIADHENETYYLLADEKVHDNVKFCVQVPDENRILLKHIENEPELFMTLMPKFAKEIAKLFESAIED